MACSCNKRNVVKQEIRKTSPNQNTRTNNTSGKRIIHRVIR